MQSWFWLPATFKLYFILILIMFLLKNKKINVCSRMKIWGELFSDLRRKNDTTYLIVRYLQLYHLSKIYLTYLIDLGVCPNSASWSTSSCGLRKINHWRVLLFYPFIVFFHSDRGQPRGLSAGVSSTDLEINGRSFYWYLSDSITLVVRQWGGICKINNS